MTTHHSDEDAFTEYLFNKLVPFVSKYWILLLITAGVLIALISAIGFFSMHSQSQEKKILNSIYATLIKKKDISTATLENLNEQYGDDEASLEVKWRLAGKYAEDKNYKGAATVYKEILAQHPDRAVAVQARLGLGSCFEEGEHYDEALDNYSEGAELYKDYPRVAAYFHFRKGFVHFYRGEYQQAEAAVEEARNIYKNIPRGDGRDNFDATFKEKTDFLSKIIKANKNKN
jgi:tetratricopeptide (TPR) repeat protein